MSIENINNLATVWWNQIVTWITDLIAGLPQLLGAIVVFAIFWYASKLVRRSIKKLFTRIEAPVSLEDLFATLARVAVIALGIMLALGVLDLDKTVTSLLAGLGIAGVAIGFAFQDIAANFMAGIFLIFKQPFEEGDVIKIGDNIGIVVEVELRSTVLRSFQGQIIRVPNQEVFKSVTENYTELGRQRIDLACGVAYGSDLEDVQYKTLQAIRAQDFVLNDPVPAMHYEEFGDSSINFKLRFWIDFHGRVDFLEARSEAIKMIDNLYKEMGVDIPFPITAIDLKQEGVDTFISKQLSSSD